MSIKNKAVRLYNTAVLLVLPSVETMLTLMARAVAFLEVREAALERHVEAHITAIVESGKVHQDAIQAVHDHFAKVNARNLSAVSKARSEAEAAVAARTAVENLLNRG